jgi:hypothetical protein
MPKQLTRGAWEAVNNDAPGGCTTGQGPCRRTGGSARVPEPRNLLWVKK